MNHLIRVEQTSVLNKQDDNGMYILIQFFMIIRIYYSHFSVWKNLLADNN